MQAQVRHGEQEAQQIEWDAEHTRGVIEADKRRVKAMKEEMKRKRETLRIEVECINGDYKAAFTKKVQMHEELNELKETILEINDDIQRRDEEILKVRIKMRQADIERERLEAELQLLRKQVGKNTRGKNA